MAAPATVLPYRPSRHTRLRALIGDARAALARVVLAVPNVGLGGALRACRRDLRVARGLGVLLAALAACLLLVDAVV